MKALTASIAALVALAMLVAVLAPGNTAGVLLALGSPFALFANVMANEQAWTGDSLYRSSHWPERLPQPRDARASC
jgi:hypothetical protein